MNKLKTNVIRILENKKIAHEIFTYQNDPKLTGNEIAKLLNEPEELVCKTLVTITNKLKIIIFVIPVSKNLNLKKIAKKLSEKSLEMLKAKDLLSYTGYVHGGCSPIGLKKNYPIYIDESVKKNKFIYISAGKIGYQIKLNVNDLQKIINFNWF